MKHKVRSKICLICKENFTPDPRVGDRQKVCKKNLLEITAQETRSTELGTKEAGLL